MKIIRFNNKSDIDVQFLDSHLYIKEHVQYAAFVKGQVKNPYDKSMCGVGCIGVGKYKVSENCVHPQEYNSWKCILKRCYAGGRKEHEKYYKNCTVCEDWLNYQNFAEWYGHNKYNVNERLHVDKDILIPGNTVYVPDRCLLVPQRINMLFMSHRPNKFGLPEGIRPAKSNKYEAFYQGKYIGTFSTLQEAFDAHAERKEKAIKDIAIEYHDILPNEVFLAVTNYHVTRWDEHK